MTASAKPLHPARPRGVDRRGAPGRGASFPLVLDDGTSVPADRRTADDRRRLGFVSRLHLFSGVPVHLVEGALEGSSLRTFAEDTVLLAPGQPNESVFFVVSGHLRVHLEEANVGRWLKPGAESQRSVLIGPGESVGEMSTIDGGPASAFVVALAGASVVAVEAAVFWENLVELSGVARNLLRLMARRMRHTNETVIEGLRRELSYARLEREMLVAQEIQRSMLPDLSALRKERGGIEVAGRVVPAREVGGDFFDAFFVDRDRLLFAVGDVCGKGVPAALFVTRAMSLLRAAGHRLGDPGQVLSRLNELLVENNDACTFVGMFCGVLDLATGELVYANGGQEPPLLRRAEGSVEFLPMPAGVVIGAMPGSTYNVARAALRPGDLLLAYTDGATEATNPAGRLYTPERLEAAVAGLVDAAPGPAVEALHAGLEAFADGTLPFDDVTLLALRFGRGESGA